MIYLRWWHCPTPAADCRWRRRLRQEQLPTSCVPPTEAHNSPFRAHRPLRPREPEFEMKRIEQARQEITQLLQNLSVFTSQEDEAAQEQLMEGAADDALAGRRSRSERRRASGLQARSRSQSTTRVPSAGNRIRVEEAGDQGP